MVSRRSFLSGAAAAYASLAGVAAAQPAPKPPIAQPAPELPAEAAAPADAPRMLVIGTGRVTGVYFPTGGAICRVLNRQTASHGLRCVVEPTDGSMENIAALRAGRLDLALVQSDWQQAAVAGTGIYESAGPFGNLRAVASLHSDTVTVLVRPDQAVGSFADLKGKRINLGPTGSALRQLAEKVVAAHGFGIGDFSAVGDMAPDRQVEALCDGSIDAAIFVVGHPNGAVRDAMVGCGARPLALDAAAIDKLVADGSPLVRTVVPARLYPTVEEDIATVGMAATLVTTAALSEDTVFALTQALFTGLEELRGEHPALEPLEAARMVVDGLTAPLHQGAERYFRDAGLRS